MKRFTLQLITAIFLLATFATPFSAYAQTPAQGNGNTSNGASTPAPSGTSLAVNTVAALTGVTPVLRAVDAVMEFLVLPIAGFVFWVTGQLLDYSIRYSLDIFSSVQAANSAIVLGWTVIRDVFNMMFIFVIIWVAIATMLDLSKWSAKQMLTKIIIAAVLINFSFFLTELIIDAGNIFGAWFYNGIIGTLGTVANSGATLSASGVSLSAGLSTALGVYNLYTPTSSVWTYFSLGDATQTLIGAYLRLGIVAFSSYIFAYVAVLFIARTVSLLFALTLSPLGFAGRILPQTQEYAKEWWDELLKNVLLAPIFLLFLYIITAFANTSLFTAVNVTTGSGTTGAIDPVQYFKYFLLAGMLLYALKAAKKQSGAIGNAVSKISSQLGQLAVGAATGGAGLVGQLTLGAAASRLAGSRGLNQAVASGGVTGALAGLAQKRISGVADYHFNPAGSVLSKETGYKTEKGYNAMMKDRGEQQKKATEALAFTPKDVKDGKEKLDEAELAAYGGHSLGDKYKAAHATAEAAKKAFDNAPGEDTNKANKAAQKNLELIKSVIDNDPEFKIKDEILKQQEETLKGIRNELKTASGDRAKDLQKQIDAMNVAMAQGRAISSAQGDRGFSPGINIAQVLGGKESKVNVGVPFTDIKGSFKIPEGVSKVASVAAQVFTAGISKAAADQYLKDNSKAVKGMREAAEGKGGKKNKEQDLTKLIADLAGEAAEATPAAPAAAPATPPAGTPPTI